MISSTQAIATAPADPGEGFGLGPGVGAFAFLRSALVSGFAFPSRFLFIAASLLGFPAQFAGLLTVALNLGRAAGARPNRAMLPAAMLPVAIWSRSLTPPLRPANSIRTPSRYCPGRMVSGWCWDAVFLG